MKKGFTLLELIIVIIIIGILAVIALPRYLANIQSARDAAVMQSLSSIKDAEAGWFSVNGVYHAAGALAAFNVDLGAGQQIYCNPQVPNYAFSIVGAGNAAYVLATPTAPATTFHGMCLASGEHASGAAAAAANPGCP